MKLITRIALVGTALLWGHGAGAVQFSTASPPDRVLESLVPSGTICGTTLLSHSTSQVPVAGNSISCNAGGLHADNAYFRVYDLAAFPAGFELCEVQFGVEQAQAGGGASNQPVTVNVYAQTGAAFPGGTRTLVGTQALALQDQAVSVVTVPLTASIPAGAQLVLEVFTPDGQAPGHRFFIGSNSAGQAAPSYIQAASCGVTTPTDTAAIGFANMQFILNARGSAASIAYSVSPASLAFSGIVGQASAAQSVTVAADAGNSANLSITSCTFAGANAADFAFETAPAFPISVAAGGSAQLPVRFTASAAGSRSGSLDCVTTGTTPGANFSVALSGTAAAALPVIALSAPTLEFGQVVVGQNRSLDLVLSNTGNAALNITGITAPTAPFSLVSDTCTGQSIAPAANCQLRYAYSPSSTGPVSQTLSITSNAAASSFTLNGVAITARPAVVPVAGAGGLFVLMLAVGGLALIRLRR